MINKLNNYLIDSYKDHRSSNRFIFRLVVLERLKYKETPAVLTCRRKNKDACARMGRHDLEGRGRVHTRLKLPLCLTGLETARPALPRRSGILIAHMRFLACTQRSAFPKFTVRWIVFVRKHVCRRDPVSAGSLINKIYILFQVGFGFGRSERGRSKV